MHRMKSWMTAVVLTFLACGGAEARSTDKTVLVIPSRYRVVQFAQDIARIRPTYIVAFATQGGPNKTVLYSWNASQEAWKDITADEFATGTIFDESARTLVWIGAEKEFPSELATAPAWAVTIEKIPSLNTADMANGLNKTLDFSATEWRWLAKRYNLTVTDLNAERRRYGKYGPPGSKVRPTTTGTTPAAEEKVEALPEAEALAAPAPVFDVKPAVESPASAPEAKELAVEKKAPKAPSQNPADK